MSTGGGVKRLHIEDDDLDNIDPDIIKAAPKREKPTAISPMDAKFKNDHVAAKITFDNLICQRSTQALANVLKQMQNHLIDALIGITEEIVTVSGKETEKRSKMVIIALQGGMNNQLNVQITLEVPMTCVSIEIIDYSGSEVIVNGNKTTKITSFLVGVNIPALIDATKMRSASSIRFVIFKPAGNIVMTNENKQEVYSFRVLTTAENITSSAVLNTISPDIDSLSYPRMGDSIAKYDVAIQLSHKTFSTVISQLQPGKDSDMCPMNIRFDYLTRTIEFDIPNTQKTTTIVLDEADGRILYSGKTEGGKPILKFVTSQVTALSFTHSQTMGSGQSSVILLLSHDMRTPVWLSHLIMGNMVETPGNSPKGTDYLRHLIGCYASINMIFSQCMSDEYSNAAMEWFDYNVEPTKEILEEYESEARPSNYALSSGYVPKSNNSEDGKLSIRDMVSNANLQVTHGRRNGTFSTLLSNRSGKMTTTAHTEDEQIDL